MHYLYVAARIAYIVITGVTHYRWGDPRVDDASPPSFARNTSQSTVQVRFLYSNSRSSHRIHPFFRVRSSRLADRINLIAEHGFRFLHSMIDRSIDRSSFSSIFKSNYFFFYENNKNTKNDLSWNLFFFNITIKFFSTGDEFFIGIF